MTMPYQSDLKALAAAQIEAQRQQLRDLPLADLQRVAATGRPWRARAMIAAVAMVRADRGELDLKSRLDLANVLDSLGRHAEALEVLGPPDATTETNTLYWVKRGQALAGEGRFAEAVEAAEVFARISKPLKEASPWRRLAEGQASPPIGWSAIAAYASEAMAQGARRAAAEAVAPLLTADPQAVDREAAATVASIALETLPPHAADALIERLTALAPDDNTVLALKLEAMLRAGDAQPISDQKRWDTADPTVHRLRAEALARCGRRPLAIHVLGTVIGKSEGAHETKAAMARIVGDTVLEAHPLRLRTRPNRKVFNLMPFDNEVELLRLRLDEMAPWVDQFVIVEARTTFTGEPKSLHFEAVRDQFAPWLPKIAHVVVDAFPAEADTACARDFWRRDMAIRALDNLAAPQDIILLTDADEIVRREALDGYTGGVLGLKMQTCRYFLNYGALPTQGPVQGQDNTHAAAVCTADHLTRYGASYTRLFQSRTGPIWDAIPNAGWRFTSLGDAAVSAKARQADTPSLSKTERRIAAILGGQFEDGWGALPVEALPRYVRDKAASLGDLLLPTIS